MPVLSRRLRVPALVAMLATLAACASAAQRTAAGPVADPVERLNRGVYRFNDTLDRWILRPVAGGWRKGVPKELRGGVRNVLDNWTTPIDIVNGYFQGKFAQGSQDLGRFLLNTTVGLGGLFDPASDIGLPVHDEDFGQTLNAWGVPQGPYLMVPVFGPFTLSHGVGALLDAPFSPYVSFSDPLPGLVLYSVDAVDSRSRFLDADAELRGAYDPYAFLRDAYLQNRAYKISDGAWAPEPALDELDDLDDEPADEPSAKADPGGVADQPAGDTPVAGPAEDPASP